jgi:hypothetical protein
MASSYTPIESHRDIQVLSGTQVIDVERVAGTTVPHGVYFERVVPLTIFGTGAATAYIAELANAIEQRLDSGLADSASFVQDVDGSGLLFDAIEFLVSYQGTQPGAGLFTTTVTVPVNLLTADTAFVGDLVSSLFEDALAQLQQTAGA